MKNKYFHQINGRAWVFAVKEKDRRGAIKWKCLVKLSDISIRRHTLIKGTASPDDPSSKEYWEKRQLNSAKKAWDKGSRFYRVMNKQKGKCPVCQDGVFNGEKIHLHHKTPIKTGGSDEVDNLVWLHKVCHQQVYSNVQLLERLKA